MQTHLSYATYQKLCEKFGAEKINSMCRNFHFTSIDKKNYYHYEIDMNVILSKEFIDLFYTLEERQSDNSAMNPNMEEEIANRYCEDGMPGVEEYILSLI